MDIKEIENLIKVIEKPEKGKYIETPFNYKGFEFKVIAIGGFEFTKPVAFIMIKTTSSSKVDWVPVKEFMELLGFEEENKVLRELEVLNKTLKELTQTIWA